HYLRNFYMRRVLRVFPIYYLALVIFLLILPLIPGLPVRLDYYVANQVWLWTYLQNWIYIFRPAVDQSTLNHLWSLAVEEQFYLLWPLAIALVPRPRFLLVLISAVLLLTVGLRTWVWINSVEGLSYFSLYTFTRIDGICIGCIIAILQKINPQFLRNNTALIVLAFAGFNFLFYFINRQYNDSFPYLAMVGYTTLAMLIGLLVDDMVNGRTPFFHLLFGLPFLKFIGRISYGCYILHWPLYLITEPFLEQWSSTHLSWLPSHYFASTAITLLSYLLGYLSYRYFEMKFLGLKKHFE
ncbi:MAG TPA: acyltransferase, partial [Flavisolibacter sp.]|nr:acyltransferase [Flavisolibacter sp.]